MVKDEGMGEERQDVTEVEEVTEVESEGRIGEKREGEMEWKDRRKEGGRERGAVWRGEHCGGGEN